MDGQITHIRRRYSSSNSTEGIYEVLLDNGETLSILTLLNYLALGFTYSFINHANRQVSIEACHPIYKEAFIKSTNLTTNTDDLLALPSF